MHACECLTPLCPPRRAVASPRIIVVTHGSIEAEAKGMRPRTHGLDQDLFEVATLFRFGVGGRYIGGGVGGEQCGCGGESVRCHGVWGLCLW